MSGTELLKVYESRLERKYKAQEALETITAERIKDFTTEEHITFVEIREKDLREIEILESTIKILKEVIE